MKSLFFLTKPGIVMGNAITCVGGYMLASKGSFEGWLFLHTLLGISLIVASGCVSNNYIDRISDSQMDRTKSRPIPRGVITPNQALIYASVLLVAGGLILAIFVNVLTLYVALFGLVVYLFFYSFLKYRSHHATLVGSVAGAIPPVVGYTAVANQLDLGALNLFLLIALWQMPHFYAIAIRRFDEYKKVSIPVLPITKGLKRTTNDMLVYIFAFMGVAIVMFSLNQVGYLFLGCACVFGAIWSLLCYQGYSALDPKSWAKNMFLYSLVVVLGVCIAIPFSAMY